MDTTSEYTRGQLEERARVLQIIIDARKTAQTAQSDIARYAATTMADHIFDMVNGGPTEFMGS